MKKIIVLSLAVISIVICGCNQPVDTHPASLVGKWKAELTTKVRVNPLANTEREADVTVGMTTGADGSANFQETAIVQNMKSTQPQTETINGTWKLADDYLIVEQSNGGFVAFRISSQATNQLTVFSRTGETIQFNRIP